MFRSPFLPIVSKYRLNKYRKQMRQTRREWGDGREGSQAQVRDGMHGGETERGVLFIAQFQGSIRLFSSNRICSECCRPMDAVCVVLDSIC